MNKAMRLWSNAVPVQKVLSVVAVFALVFMPFAQAEIVLADHDIGAPYEEEILGNLQTSEIATIDKIRICHATGSEGNPYANPEVNISSFFSGGHDTDLDDIIPPFHYDDGDGNEAFLGMNWEEPFISTWENGCVAPEESTTGSVTVTKVVVNDGGGEAEISDFPLFVDEESVVSGVAEDFEAGDYVISETNTDENYVAVITGDCDEEGDLTVEVDGEYFCTITNTFDPGEPTTGTLVVKKVVINDNEGTATSSDFSFIVNGGQPIPFDVDGQNDLVLPVGSYNVTEVAAGGYSVSSSNCSNINLTVNGWTCEITNNDIPPTASTLTVIKETLPDGATQSFDFELDTDPFATLQDNDGGSGAIVVSAGVHLINEIGLPDWSLTGWQCLNDQEETVGTDMGESGIELTFSEGEDITCTFTNTEVPVEDSGNLIIRKVVINDNGGSADATSFKFIVDGGAPVQFESDGRNQNTP